MTPLDKLKEARRLTAEAGDDLYLALGYGHAGAPAHSTVAQIQKATVHLHDVICLLVKDSALTKKQRGTPPSKA